MISLIECAFWVENNFSFEISNQINWGGKSDAFMVLMLQATGHLNNKNRNLEIILPTL